MERVDQDDAGKPVEVREPFPVPPEDLDRPPDTPAPFGWIGMPAVSWNGERMVPIGRYVKGGTAGSACITGIDPQTKKHPGYGRKKAPRARPQRLQVQGRDRHLDLQLRTVGRDIVPELLVQGFYDSIRRRQGGVVMVF